MFKTYPILLILFIKESVQFGTNLTLPYLLSDYFLLKSIYSLKINHCHSKQEINSIHRHFKGSGIKVKCENVNKNNWIHTAMAGGDYSKIGVYLDMDCLTNKTYNIITDEIKNYTGSNYHWLIKIGNCNESFTFLNALPLNWDSQFSLLTSDGKIYQLHKEGKSKLLSMSNTAIWNSIELKTIKTVTKEDLNGLAVKGFISVYADPGVSGILNYLRTKTNDPRDNLAKFSFTLHDILIKKYNGKLKLYLANRTETGKIYKFINGSLSYYSGGQFYMLEKGLADIGLYPAEPLSAGLDKMSILPSITTFRQCFIFKHPRRFTKFMDILSPFSSIVWSALIAISVLFVCLMRLTLYHVNDTESSTVFQIILVISSLTQQGLTDTCERMSKKIIYFSLLILSTLTYGFYNASFLILMLSPPTKYINSIEKLLNNDIQLGAEDVPLNRFQLITNYNNLGEKSQSANFSRPEMFYSLFDGVKMMREKSFAFFTHDSNILSLVETEFKEQEKCNLAEVDVFKPFVVSSFIRKNLPYKELFARGILLLKESGIIARESRFWFRKKAQCFRYDEYIVADFKSAYFAYAVYFFGICCSITLLGLELLYLNKLKKKK
ncbi:uncharacterized protein LOC106669549 isoform X2 [Cimex lectularius]|uniref:Ionotropic receptor n=1 Tax=Cimex lectularius TaxID=79782 RepID=A0A8I6S022_CIMLE|nr:uncharacterized protein LOC106669549 isoform X2 [Cimex lectularius]